MSKDPMLDPAIANKARDAWIAGGEPIESYDPSKVQRFVTFVCGGPGYYVGDVFHNELAFLEYIYKHDYKSHWVGVAFQDDSTYHVLWNGREFFHIMPILLQYNKQVAKEFTKK